MKIIISDSPKYTVNKIKNLLQFFNVNYEFTASDLTFLLKSSCSIVPGTGDSIKICIISTSGVESRLRGVGFKPILLDRSSFKYEESISSCIKTVEALGCSCVLF